MADGPRAAIQPLDRGDLPEVAALYEEVVRSGSRTPAPGLAAYFERTLLDHPWADPDIPSLVYRHDGRIRGFVGAHVRRFTFDEEPVRVVAAGQLVSEPAVRRRGAGTLLLRHLLSGQQDLTFTGATPTVRAMWERLGGHARPLQCLNWTRPLRPARYAGDALLAERVPRLQPVARRVLAAADLVARRFVSPDPVGSLTRPLTIDALLDHLPEVSAGRCLVPAYDAAFLRWLFTEMSAVTFRGPLERRLVQDTDGRVLGWYVAYRQPDGIWQLMQLAATDRDAPAVLDRMLEDARGAGAMAVQGRLEEALLEALLARRTLIGRSNRSVVHSRRPELVAAVLQGQALLTRMEGEWWMGHDLERFQPAVHGERA